MADLARVIATLKSDVNALGFRGQGRNGSLANDVQAVVAEIVINRTVLDQKEVSGNALAPLMPSTIERKRRAGRPETILVEKGDMLAEAQVRGELTDFRDHEIEITYGTDGEERQKAEWAHKGASNRAARPFYGIGDDDTDHAAIDAVVHDGLDRQARNNW